MLFSRFFGNSAEFWMGLQSQYDLETEQDRLTDRLNQVPEYSVGVTARPGLPDRHPRCVQSSPACLRKAGIRPDQSFPKTLAEQSRLTFANIDRALKAAGAGREDVVEISIYIVDLENVDPNPVYEDVRNFFPAGHKPASMVIGVSALAYPGLLVEINVRAATD